MSNQNKYRVFVCTKKRDINDPEGSCFHCGGLEIYQAFVDEVKQQKLADRVEIRKSGCLDRCELGAVALVSQVKSTEPSWLPTKIQKRILSNKHYYDRLNISGIHEIVENHFING
jgi:predicted metal-binding protein